MAANPRSLEVTLAYGRRLKAVERRVKRFIRNRWQLGPGDLDERYEAWKAEALRSITQAQLLNVQLTAGFLSAFETLERGGPVRPVAIDPSEFVGKTYGGADLGEWVDKPKIDALAQIKAGRPVPEAAANALDKAVMDAGLHTYAAQRGALSSAMQSRQGVIGYRRVVVGETCGGCLAAAKNDVLMPTEQFATHPNCDCVAEPVLGDVSDRYKHPSGLEQYERLTSTQKAEAVGPEAAQAIADGAISLFDLKGAWTNDFAPDFLTQRPLSDAI